MIQPLTLLEKGWEAYKSAWVSSPIDSKTFSILASEYNTGCVRISRDNRTRV
ncbi:hypothetical protein D3C74_501440 [compost metagenome]